MTTMPYYSETLAGRRLRMCYEIAPPRVQQYLEAEISFVIDRLAADDSILDLGCGYGRAALPFATAARRVVGIDTAAESLALARELAGAGESAAAGSRCEFLEMDATALRFPDGEFDVVACIQNGICAFGIDPLTLVREAVRVARPGGRVLFSSYAERFWPHRLRWFELQAAEGLLGEIDRARTGEGVIVCVDGFRAGTMSATRFRSLCAALGVTPKITEVDNSSLFCELVAP
jgi:2-polyprenyl-6-hydroxyphenyl methylase/3-demethylubiquinone-9 3-methyltransferase